jgi:hypothetical protein
MEPIVTSSSALRFFYGTTTLSGDASVFSGVVVHGTDLVFGPETGFPVGGTIDRIDGGAEKDELRGGDCDDMIYGRDATTSSTATAATIMTFCTEPMAKTFLLVAMAMII